MIYINPIPPFLPYFCGIHPYLLMTKQCLYITIFLFLSAHSYAQQFNYERDYPAIVQRSKNTTDSLSYKKLLPKFLNNDATLTVYETLCVMIGYTGLSNYKPFDDLKTERYITTLNDSAKYELALKTCDTFLAHHPLNQKALIEKAYAFYKLKNDDSATFYKGQFAKIMAAMDWSNNGRTANTAMFAIGPEDGQNFVDKYYHAEVGSIAATTDKDGNYCSKIEMKYKQKARSKA